MSTATSAVALIPARSGSKRVPHKNIRSLAGHPMLAYTIAAARLSGIFTDIIVSTDSQQYADTALCYGAEVPYLRPASFAGDLSPDIEWVEDLLLRMREAGRQWEFFSILRPTNPFRLPSTIRRAWDVFSSQAGLDSLRAVEKCKQHPGKMWVIRQGRMLPLLPLSPPEQPWHSSQYQALPEVWVQNASLELARTNVVFESRTIAGATVAPFFTQGYEGFDVNHPEDWELAEAIVAQGLAELPDVESLK